jgi:hypothetical protein
MAFITNPFGGKTKKGPKAESFDYSAGQAEKLTAPTEREQALMDKLGISADQADQGMLDEIRALGERGDDLSRVDEDYMNRAYQPAFSRLMNDYSTMDRGILEDMNRRGVSSGPGAASEPEAYQRMLLQRSTQQTMANTMMEAQNQAVQQKLAQYNARLAEPTVAANRYGQTMTPYQNATIVPESERMATKAGVGTSIYGARLGQGSAGYAANTQKNIAQGQNMMNLIGSGIGAAAMLSDPAAKKNITAGPDPEEDLQEMTETPINRWQYRNEPDAGPMHEGAMANEAPEDTQVPGGIDIPSYLGKLTNSVKALNKKIGAYELLLQGGV